MWVIGGAERGDSQFTRFVMVIGLLNDLVMVGRIACQHVLILGPACCLLGGGGADLMLQWQRVPAN